MGKYLLITLITVFVVGGLLFLANKSESEKFPISPSPTSQPTILPTDGEKINATITPMQETNELVIEDVKVGTGTEATVGKKVTVNYRGNFTNGIQFDSSYDRGIPFDFVLGEGAVIEGWDQGVVGMKIGGKRKLTIPPSLGYGAQAIGSIPPNSTLVFEIELLKVE